jgi:dTDP-4-amino-4,6-dideoxygalactose transaminase
MKNNTIPFNVPCVTGKELEYISEAIIKRSFAGDGEFTKLCERLLEELTGCPKVLMTHSCTAALEMAALLLALGPGDEVIMPSYTFSSSANAFVLRGAVPVFVDIRENTLNLDERLIESAVTPRTRAVVAVHYAGVACEMDTILALAKRHGFKVVEDAAQGVMAGYKGRPLGTIGDLGAYSFHETKNIICGEGGSILVNDCEFASRAEIIREKGTDRSRYLRGEVDKYTWQDKGSSYAPADINAAFLLAQLQEAETITRERLRIWQQYNDLLEPLERDGVLLRPALPKECQHNAHMYYIILSPEIPRQHIMDEFRRRDIWSLTHYVPLHTANAGQKYGRIHGELAITQSVSERLIRLPLWVGLREDQQERVVGVLEDALSLVSR